MKANFTDLFTINLKKGFSLVELMVVLVISSILATTAYKIFSFTIYSRNRNSVELQELQGARTAINYLRRDIRCAAPFVPKSSSIKQRRKSVQEPIMNASYFPQKAAVIPILVSESEVHFFKYNYGSKSLTQQIEMEEVNYRFDKKRKCLVRTCAKKEKTFKDIKAARFELYTHPLGNNTPMLLVTLEIKSGGNLESSSDKSFILSTTICSAITNQNINYLNWNSSLN